MCIFPPRLIDWISYSQMSVLAEDGMCKPFDASADGWDFLSFISIFIYNSTIRFSRAEGCVSVVLKPLEQATKDGDHIYGIVRPLVDLTCNTIKFRCRFSEVG